MGKKVFPELHASSAGTVVVRARFTIFSPAKNWVLNLGVGGYSGWCREKEGKFYRCVTLTLSSPVPGPSRALNAVLIRVGWTGASRRWEEVGESGACSGRLAAYLSHSPSAPGLVRTSRQAGLWSVCVFVPTVTHVFKLFFRGSAPGLLFLGPAITIAGVFPLYFFTT